MKRLTDPERALRLEARKQVRKAIEKGILIRPKCCQYCGSSGRGCGGAYYRPEAHHEDYTKPLDVLWLCHGCHRYADKMLRRRWKREAAQRLAREQYRTTQYGGFPSLKEWKRNKFPLSSPDLSS